MITILAVIFIPLLIYFYVYKPHQHWKNLNVPYIKPVPILGNMSDIFFQKKSLPEWIQSLYNKQTSKVSGIYSFNLPVLMIKDLNLIKKIGIKDFDHFVDHRPLISADIDPLFGKNLFTLRGEKWRNMRSTLSPAFTSSKMRSLFVLISECAEQFTNYFLDAAENEKPLDIELKDTFTRFANDVIATTAFGIQCNSLKDKDNEFFLMGKDATNFKGLQLLKFFMYHVSKTLMKVMKVQIFSKKVRDFFRNIIKTTIAVREKEGIIRQDMLHLLIEARKGKLKHEAQKDEGAGFATVNESEIGKDHLTKIDLSEDDITAQALLFFIAGFDTISTAMCFMTYELAQHPDIQQRLQKEIDDTLESCKGKVTYEVLVNMKYLDMVLTETLRKWPPSPALDRMCTKDFTIPAEDADGVEIHIKANEVAWIPVFPIHRDPQHYPDPDKFDPERFSDENKDEINPMAFLPFGVGPRNCIGSRFALMEAKVIAIHILSKFSFVLTNKSQVPLVLQKGHLSFNGEKGIWAGLIKRNTSANIIL